MGSFKKPARLVESALALHSADPIVGPVVRMPDGTSRTAYPRAAEQATHYVATLVCGHAPGTGLDWPCVSCLALAAEQIDTIVDVLRGVKRGRKRQRTAK